MLKYRDKGSLKFQKENDKYNENWWDIYNKKLERKHRKNAYKKLKSSIKNVMSPSEKSSFYKRYLNERRYPYIELHTEGFDEYVKRLIDDNDIEIMKYQNRLREMNLNKILNEFK